MASEREAPQSWAVIDLIETTGYVHVVPWLGSDLDGDVYGDHKPTPLCPCGPQARRNGPLDRFVVLSHQQADWPGANLKALLT